MKKLLSLLIALSLVFTLVACDNTDEPVDVVDPVVDPVDPVEPLTPFEEVGMTMTDAMKDSEDYRLVYTAHYETLNYLESQSAGDNEYTANMVDGLVEVNKFNQIVPALATGWSSAIVDGKEVWTFDIREGVYWQENDTLLPVAEVVAQDWVTSAQYILEPGYNSELISLLTTFIDGGQNYYCSKQALIATESSEEAPQCTTNEDYTYNVDFAAVGVKATSKYTLEYTLIEPAPYFITVLTYNAYYPVNVDYLLSVGEEFGSDSTKILINGPYSMSADVKDIKIDLTRNPYYWDAGHVYAEAIEFVFAGGDLGTDYYRKLYEAGEIDGFRIMKDDISGMAYYVYGENNEGTDANPVRPEAVVRGTVSPYTYHNIWNYDRDSYVGNPDRTEAENTATKAAILNADFRLGFTFGSERAKWNSIWTPDNPNQWMRNTYSPRELAADSKGRDYVEYVYDVIAEMENLDRELVGEMYADGNDALYQPERAMEHFVAAKATLIAEGLTEADFPIQVEINTSDYKAADRIPHYEAFVESFNAQFGEYAIYTLTHPANSDENKEYQSTAKSYDMYDAMGWGPDYQDPKTYLNTYAINGDMISYAGLGADNFEIQELVLSDFDVMFREAAAITDSADIDERMRKFAEAEYQLLFVDGIILPLMSPRGDDIFISNIMPFQVNSVNYGLGKYKYKGLIVLDGPITAEERTALEAELEAERAAQ